MDSLLLNYIRSFPTIVLLLIICISLYTLGKGADMLVDEAVSLSVRWGIPKMIVGATIVSLGTTLPEVTVSVLAALNGNPDLALGNSIGSIIADTGLIIGVAAMVGHLPIDKTTLNRQGRVQILAGVLLAVVCLPFLSSNKTGMGIIPQWMGWIFLILLASYLFISFKWAKDSKNDEKESIEDEVALEKASKPIPLQLVLMILGIAIVIVSSKVLIPCVEVTALRVGIPQSIIAATLVAFGTSLPELITAITAVRKGHGELAVGNIVGADVLNVLFVTGSAAAVTRGGLNVPPSFYRLQIPAMLIILISFRYFSKNKNHVISKKEGMLLASIYTLYIILSYAGF